MSRLGECVHFIRVVDKCKSTTVSLVRFCLSRVTLAFIVGLGSTDVNSGTRREEFVLERWYCTALTGVRTAF